jgi:purine-binding chemotaxis protein CheW
MGSVHSAVDSLDDFEGEDDDFEPERIEDTFLVFAVGEGEYALGIKNVTEIVRMQRIVPVPDMHGYVPGVINLRGRVIPVMDIRRRFGMAPRDYCDRTVIVILETESSTAGLVVDAVCEVCEIAPADIEPISEAFSRGSVECGVIRGISRRAERTMLVLDSARLANHTPEANEVAAA